MTGGFVGDGSDLARTLTKGYVGIPSTFTPVEYIQNSEAQYIDTGVCPNANIQCVVDFQYTKISGSSLIGGWDASKGMLFGINNSKFQFAFGTSAWAGSTVTADLNRHTLYMNDENGDGRLDNTILASHSNVVSLTNEDRPMYLFKSNGGVSFGNVKIYSCKIYDSGTLIRDFVPVANELGVYCFWDTVGQRAYYNSGVTNFLGGTTTGGASTQAVVNRKIIKGYVGVSGVARICYGHKIPTLRTYIEDAVHISNPSVTNTADYILIGGGTTSGSTRIKTVTAYPDTLVAVSAPDLTTQAWNMGSCNFNGYGIFAGGMTGSNGSSRTNQCLAYDNTLTKTTLPTLNAAVYDLASASNSVHFLMAGGTNYSAGQTTVVSYNTSFAKSTLSNMSGPRSQNAAAAVGQYLVCCGIWDSHGNTDFYDNSNVKTTGSDAYGKATDNVLGLSTTDYAVFWGGATAYNGGQYSDCRAYDKNKVLYKFNLPAAYWKMQGVYNGSYVWLCNKTESFVYTNNLVLLHTTTETDNIYGEGQYIQAATTKGFAIHHKHGTSRLNILDV